MCIWGHIISIAACYGLDGKVFKPWWGKVISNIHTSPLVIKTFSTKEIISIIKSLK